MLSLQVVFEVDPILLFVLTIISPLRFVLKRLVCTYTNPTSLHCTETTRGSALARIASHCRKVGGISPILSYTIYDGISDVDLLRLVNLIR